MALSISLTDKINVFMTQKCVVKKFHNGTIQTFSFFTERWQVGFGNLLKLMAVGNKEIAE